MRIRNFPSLLAAIAFTASATPAQADGLDAILSIASEVADLTDPQGWDPCWSKKGLHYTVCRVRYTRDRAERATRLVERVSETRSPTRPSPLESAPSANLSLLRHCSAGGQMACQELDMAPHQASYILSRID